MDGRRRLDRRARRTMPGVYCVVAWKAARNEMLPVLGPPAVACLWIAVQSSQVGLEGQLATGHLVAEHSRT